MGDSATEKSQSGLRNGLARLGWTLGGAVLGALAGMVWLVAVVVLFLLYAFVVGQSSGNIPDRGGKIILTVLVSLVVTGLLYYFWDWQGVLIGGASLGGAVGAFAGFAIRMYRERRDRKRGG